MDFIASFHKYIIYFSGLVVASIGTYIRGSDPHFDPFCVWGKEIFMTDRQVRKLKKIFRRKRQEMRIKLFVYSLSKTTMNFRISSYIGHNFFNGNVFLMSPHSKRFITLVWKRNPYRN